MLSEHDLTVVGALDQLVEELRTLSAFLRHRVVSRGGDLTFVAADVRRQVLLPANRFRHMAVIQNDSTATMFLALGSDAATDLWTYKLLTGDTLETPAGYIGPITAVWSAQNGAARITELT